MSAYDYVRQGAERFGRTLEPAKPMTESVTLQGLAIAAAMTAGPIILQRRLPRAGELVRLGGIAWGIYGRLRPGAGQPLRAG